MKNLNFLMLLLSMALISGCVASKKAETASGNNAAAPVEQSGTDVLAMYAWHLDNTGQTSFAGLPGISGQDLNIKEVIDLGYRGTGIKIAVSDTGVDLSHPDLNDNALTGQHRNYASTSSGTWKASNANPFPADKEGHGTAVAGLVSAEGWNTIGSRGVAPESKFAAFYFIGPFTEVADSYEAKTLDQLWGNFDIFNYSYGYQGCSFVTSSQIIMDTYKQGVTSLRGNRGAIYVKAAGNDYVGYNDECFPSAADDSYFLGNSNSNEDQNIPYLILAAAVNAKGQIASYSTPGSGVWISSAGGEFGHTSSAYAVEKSPAMISTDIMGCVDGMSTTLKDESAFNMGSSNLNLNCDYTNIMNGTSAATPTLSGVVALMLSANPLLGWRDVKHILAVTAQKVNYTTGALAHPFAQDLSNHVYDYVYVQNRAGYKFSNTYGFGRVDAAAAVQMALSYNSSLGVYLETQNPNNDGWYYSSGAISTPIPDENSAGAQNTINVRHNYKIESVQIELSTDHTRIGELGVELISPLGTVSKLLLVNSNVLTSTLTNFTMISNAFYNEDSRGNWKIHVIDGLSANDGNVYTGNLTKWSIKINGHKGTYSDITHPEAPTALSGAGTDPSLTQSPAITFTGSVATDVLRYEVAVGTTAMLEDKAKWYSIGNATSFTVTNLSLTSGSTYYVKIRAVDNFENASTVVTKSWQAGTM